MGPPRVGISSQWNRQANVVGGPYGVREERLALWAPLPPDPRARLSPAARAHWEAQKTQAVLRSETRAVRLNGYGGGTGSWLYRLRAATRSYERRRMFLRGRLIGFRADRRGERAQAGRPRSSRRAQASSKRGSPGSRADGDPHPGCPPNAGPRLANCGFGVVAVSVPLDPLDRGLPRLCCAPVVAALRADLRQLHELMWSHRRAS